MESNNIRILCKFIKENPNNVQGYLNLAECMKKNKIKSTNQIKLVDFTSNSSGGGSGNGNNNNGRTSVEDIYVYIIERLQRGKKCIEAWLGAASLMAVSCRHEIGGQFHTKKSIYKQILEWDASIAEAYVCYADCIEQNEVLTFIPGNPNNNNNSNNSSNSNNNNGHSNNIIPPTPTVAQEISMTKKQLYLKGLFLNPNDHITLNNLATLYLNDNDKDTMVVKFCFKDKESKEGTIKEGNGVGSNKDSGSSSNSSKDGKDGIIVKRMNRTELLLLSIEIAPEQSHGYLSLSYYMQPRDKIKLNDGRIMSTVDLLLKEINIRPYSANAYVKLARTIENKRKEITLINGNRFSVLGLYAVAIHLDKNNTYIYWNLLETMDKMFPHSDLNPKIKLLGGKSLSKKEICLKLIEIDPNNFYGYVYLSDLVDSNHCLNNNGNGNHSGGNSGNGNGNHSGGNSGNGISSACWLPNGEVMDKKDLLKKCIELDPSNARVFNNLAIILSPGEKVKLSNGMVMNKQQLLIHSINLDPNLSEPYSNLQSLLLNNNNNNNNSNNNKENNNNENINGEESKTPFSIILTNGTIITMKEIEEKSQQCYNEKVEQIFKDFMKMVNQQE